MAGMLESLFKQLNPSTLTAACLIPNFTRPQPPPLTRDEDEDGDESEGEGEIGLRLSSPNRAS